MYIKSEMSSSVNTSPKSTLFTIENILKDTRSVDAVNVTGFTGISELCQPSDVTRSRVPTPERPMEAFPLPSRKRQRDEDAERTLDCVTPKSELDDGSFSTCSRASTPSSCGPNSSFDDETGPSRKKKSRTCFTNKQLDDLEHAYVTQRYLPASERKQLAQKLKLTDQQVKTWFQNRRMKEKRQVVTATTTSPDVHQMAAFAMSTPVLPPGVFPQSLPVAMPSRLSPVQGQMPFPQFSAMPMAFPGYSPFPNMATSPPQYPMMSPLDLTRHSTMGFPQAPVFPMGRPVSQ